jgi:hypothetical protein
MKIISVFALLKWRKTKPESCRPITSRHENIKNIWPRAGTDEVYRVSKKTDIFATNLNNKGVKFFLLTLYTRSRLFKGGLVTHCLVYCCDHNHNSLKLVQNVNEHHFLTQNFTANTTVVLSSSGGFRFPR